MSIVRLLPENAVVGETSHIFYEGNDLAKYSNEQMRRIRGKDISVVFQEPMSSLNPVLTVGDQIAEVLRMHMPISQRAARDRALELLGEVGIPEPRARLDAYPPEPSGGQ